jgi:hypothetical protein
MAKDDSLLQKYLDNLRADNIQSMTKKSRDWFIDMAMSGELKATAEKILKDANTRNRPNPIIGKMYMFKYDTKHKKTLPYYDRYPLIILADRPKKGTGFYGLNLHYINAIDRAKLLTALEKGYSSTPGKFQLSTRLKISYQILKSASKLKAFRPTFKRYLRDHIKSALIEIPSEYWEVAIFLPTSKFVKADVSKVWSDSKKQY